MRLSCNGCRVLRKGCSDDCPIRPCLRWIKTSQSQASATVFLAKFYGRAGLINLLIAGPDHLRPAIFKSLLFEACGRIINPVHGSAGLLWSGSWQLCKEAVDAVLNGAPITRISDDSVVTGLGPPLQACDIRHVSKPNKGSSDDCLRKIRSRRQFKRQAAKLARADSASRESDVSQGPVRWSDSDTASVESVEPSVLRQDAEHGLELELELTLGFDRTVKRASVERRGSAGSGSDEDTCRLRVGFDAWE